MKVNDYSKLIEKNFSYLFSRFEFKTVYENQDGDSRCYIGVQSDILKVRLLFAKEQQGSGVPLIGPVMASFYVLDNGQWVGLIPLLYYLGGNEMNWEAGKNSKNDDGRTDTDMALISEIFEPLAGQVVNMFNSNETIQKWRPAFELDLQRKMEGKYKHKLRGATTLGTHDSNARKCNDLGTLFYG